MRHAVICLLAVLVLALVAAPILAQPMQLPAADKPELGPPPAGLTVELLPKPEKPATDPQAQPAAPVGQQQAAPQDNQTQEPQYELSYDGVPFETVLYDISEKLNVMILCMDDKVLKRNIKLQESVPEKQVIGFVASRQMQQARPAMILCTKEEVMDGELCPKVDGIKHVKITLEDAVLFDALDYISKLADVTLTASPDMADKTVTFASDDITLADLMDKLAEKLEGAKITGYVIQPVDPEEGLKRLEKLSDEQLNAMFGGGMDAMDRGTANNPDAARRMGQGMGRGLGNFMDTFDSMDPQEQQEFVNKGVGMVERFKGIMGRLSPDVQGRLKQHMQPMVSMMSQGFMGLPAGKRQRLQPMFDAFSNMGW